MVNPWFKFYGGEYLSDPKIGSLIAQERSCWTTLLSLASISSTPGMIEFLTVEFLLEKSGIKFDPYHPEEWDKCLGVLTKFERMKMIKTDIDGKIEVLNWEKRQEKTLTNAERQAKYRENKKSNEKVTGVTTEVTLEEKREEENRIDKSKNTYGEFQNVLLTDEEYEKLKEKLGEKNTHILIEELSGYLASTKKKYHSHYATLLNWARRKVTEHQSKLQVKTKTIA